MPLAEKPDAGAKNPFDDIEPSDAPGGAIVYKDDEDILKGLDEIDEKTAKEPKKKKSAAATAPKKNLAKDDDEGEGKDKKPKPKPAAKPKEEDEDDKDDDSDDDEDDDDDQADDAEDDDDDAKDDDDAEADDTEDDDDESDAGDEAGAGDAEDEDDIPSKALAKLHRARQRQDEDHRRRDGELRQRAAQFEQERTTFVAERDELVRSRDEIKALSARVKSSPQAAIALLRRLGMTKDVFKVTDGDWQRWWSEDTGPLVEADGVRRELDELKSWKAKQEKDAKDREDAQREHQAIAGYMKEVVGRVDEKRHPLIHANKKNDPESAHARLFAVADEMARRLGRRPNHREVVDEAERRLREDAKRIGLKIPKRTKPDPNADETRTAKPKPSQHASGRASERAQDDDEEDDDTKLRRELDELDAKQKASRSARRR